MKYFHNAFAYYGRLKRQKNQLPKELNYFSSYDVMLKYICAKNIYITSFFKTQIYSNIDLNEF
jgi:hypothetical protein